MSSTPVMVKVAEDESVNGVVELPTENDNSLKAQTLSLKFPECFALAYKSGRCNKWKGVTKKNDKFIPPQGGWGVTTYICVKGKKHKFKLTNIEAQWTKTKIQEHLESYGVVEVQGFNKKSKTAYVTIRFIIEAHLEYMKTQTHPFTIEKIQNTNKEKFNQRSGTTNKGHEFEHLTMASILLNLTLDEKVQDFRMSSDDDEFSSFDDIVLEIESIDGDVRKYAIQVKYKTDSKQPLKKHIISVVDENFSIQKYFNDFTDMVEYTKSYKLILFTNVEFSCEEGESLKLHNTDIELQIVKNNLPDKLGMGFAYSFAPKSSEISTEHKMFFDNFLLYTNQPKVEQMEQNLSEKFNTEFSFKNIHNYLKFILEWNTKTNKSKNKLNKTFIKELIALQMLGGFIKSFPTVERGDNEKVNLLKTATSGFTATVVDEKHFENIKQMWQNETMNGSEIERIIVDFHLRNLSDDEKRIAALWIVNRCPLIIAESEMAYKVITLCSEKHFVVLKKTNTPLFTQNLKVFTRLTDLDPNSTIYKNIAKSFYCSIQGKEEISLDDLANQCSDFENSVTTNELIQMLDGPLCIGKQETVLDIYIDRLVTRHTIDYTFFDSVDKDTLLIISCQGKESILKNHLKNFNLINIEEHLNQKQEVEMETFKTDNQTNHIRSINEKTAYFSKNQCTQEKFDVICKRNPSKKCHHFRIIEDGVLEWMYSKGKISDLQKYKTNFSFLKETDLNSIEETINIITADPGMGKTELMKKFNNTYSPSFWTILIKAKDWHKYLNKREDCNKDNFFEILFKTICKTKFEADMLKVMKNSNRITFLWDGLDELLSTQVDNVIELIDDFVREGFKQWISCRKHLESKLEKKFNVLSRSIKQFDKEEQRNYIYRRLNANKEMNLEDVVYKIQNYVDKVQYNEILGIPLQIFMLTELLLNRSNLLHTLQNEVFPITDLYHYFIEMKFEIFLNRKYKLKETNPFIHSIIKGFREEQLKYHQKLALTIILKNDSLLEKLDIALNSSVSNEETIIIYGIGIITGKRDDGQSQFLHHSYAEYLVALYFYENRKQFNVLIKEHIFEEHYQNVRFMFDLLLARDCPAHLAVLYNNFDYLKSCKDYTCKDEGGRNPLQIACAWGPRFPLLKTVQQGDDFFIDDDDERAGVVNLSSEQHYDEILNLLLKHNNIFDKDSIFHLNSIEYADLSLSLKPLAIFSNDKSQFPFHSLKNFKDIFTVLYYSVKFNFSFVLCSLQNIPVLKTIKNCNTILHLASDNNSIHCINVLLKGENYRLKIDAKNRLDETSIFKAAEKGHYEVVKYLAESGADVNIQNQNGWLPIHIAALNGHIEVVRLLVNDLKVNVNVKESKGFTPICAAIYNGHYEVVKYLAESKADVNIQNPNGWVPIHIAAFNGHIEVVKLLVNDLKVNVNVKENEGFTPICAAIYNGHYEVVKYLLESGADLNIENQNGWVPIHIAAQSGHIEVIKLLVNDLKANVNIKDKKGSTPISFAARNGHYEVVKYLAESGADVNIQNQDGNFPIHIAAKNGHIEVIKLLVNDLKVNVNVKENEGFTPIYLAAENGHYEVVKYLVESGADVNIQNQNGDVSIHIAAFNGHIEVVKLLFNYPKVNINV